MNPVDNTENENFADSLMKSAMNDYTADALIDSSETILDSTVNVLKNDEVLSKIPVVKYLAGFTKGVISYRERRYVSKLLSFLSETSKASESDKERYKQKLNDNPEEATRAGETILDIIDKLTSKTKAVYVGKLFRAFMHEESMTFSQLIYFCEIIQRLYLKDLESLLVSDISGSNENLESAGIVRPVRTEDINKAIGTAITKFQASKDREAELAAMGGIVAPHIDLFKESGLLQPRRYTDAGSELIRILRNYT